MRNAKLYLENKCTTFLHIELRRVKCYFDLYLLKVVQVSTTCRTSLWWVVALYWNLWLSFTGVKTTGWDLLV